MKRLIGTCVPQTEPAWQIAANLKELGHGE